MNKLNSADGVWRTFHMCVDIEDVLRWPDKDLRALFTDDDGSKKPGKVIRDLLKLQLAQGKRVLPMGKRCEGFSDIDGCPGHETQPKITAYNPNQLDQLRTEIAALEKQCLEIEEDGCDDTGQAIIQLERKIKPLEAKLHRLETEAVERMRRENK